MAEIPFGGGAGRKYISARIIKPASVDAGPNNEFANKAAIYVGKKPCGGVKGRIVSLEVEKKEDFHAPDPKPMVNHVILTLKDGEDTYVMEEKLVFDRGSTLVTYIASMGAEIADPIKIVAFSRDKYSGEGYVATVGIETSTGWARSNYRYWSKKPHDGWVQEGQSGWYRPADFPRENMISPPIKKVAKGDGGVQISYTDFSKKEEQLMRIAALAQKKIQEANAAKQDIMSQSMSSPIDSQPDFSKADTGIPNEVPVYDQADIPVDDASDDLPF